MPRAIVFLPSCKTCDTHTIFPGILTSKSSMGKFTCTFAFFIPFSNEEISEDDLRQFKKSKVINRNFQKLMMYQIERAREYVARGEELIKKIYRKMDVDCKFILNLLVSLYKSTMDKIEKVGYNVFIGEHEMGVFEIFLTTLHHAREHSFGKIKTVGLGLSLSKKVLLKKIIGNN